MSEIPRRELIYGRRELTGLGRRHRGKNSGGEGRGHRNRPKGRWVWEPIPAGTDSPSPAAAEEETIVVADNLPTEVTLSADMAVEAVKTLLVESVPKVVESARQVDETELPVDESARQVDETAEQHRITYERWVAETAERQRVEHQRLVVEASKAQAEQQEAIRQNTYSLSAHPVGNLYPPGFAVAGKGAIALEPEVTQGLGASLRMALFKLSTGTVASMTGPLAVTVAAAFYPVNVSKGLHQSPCWDRPPLAGSIPLSNLGISPATGSAKQDDIELPIRMLIADADGFMEIHAVKTGVAGISAKVKVVAAQYDAHQETYTFTTDHRLPRTFTFTSSGADISMGEPAAASTPPASRPTSDVVIRHAVIHTVLPQPTWEDRDFHDYIIGFPANSGLEPVYVYFKNPRYESGTVSGQGKTVSGLWFAGASRGLGAAIPTAIADQLRGRRFSTFDKFSEAFWAVVGHDPELSRQFKRHNIALMKKRFSPFTPASEKINGRDKFECHHVNTMKEGGAVYDMDNLRIATPKRYIKIQSRNKGE
ncbi:S-type pyocin domain-containing protein [Yersinia mollaretii]|uniref:S-type pyocin domain-containing protein n=1 Tax=Yersinia mollaretii TaxID=33060 RepID=UPI0011A48BA1|nr:S-type pyocin domain-containing protein [Yersinia mollaretii]